MPFFFRILILLSFIASVGTPAAFAGHEGHRGEGVVPQDILSRPVALRSGIGVVNDPIQTRSPQAQAFYNQGVAYLHSFMWIEAARSFNQALRLDPDAALAWIGLGRALVQVEDLKGAENALAKAEALEEKTPRLQKNRIRIFAAELAATGSKGDAAKEKAYFKAIEDALADDPGDAELWLIRGQAAEGPGGIGMAGSASGIAFYEAALKRAPDHFAAHHYLIHSYEAIGRIDEAVRHGEAYAALAPQIPHAHHMYGHNLRRAGRIDEATERFEKAYQLEMTHYARENIPRQYDWHHPHNLSLLAMAYQYQGRMKEAEKILGELWSLPPVTPFIQFNRKAWPEYLLVRDRSEEALQSARELAAGSYPAGRAGGHAMAGVALLRMGQVEEAEQELTAAEAEAGEGRTNPYIDILVGAILIRNEDSLEEGEDILGKAMEEVRSIPGPDAWMLALFRLELIALLARDAGDWDLAEEAAQEMLEHDAAYAGSHYALALVLENRGELSEARKEFEEAERLWRKADPDLHELRRMKERRAQGLGPFPA